MGNRPLNTGASLLQLADDFLNRRQLVLAVGLYDRACASGADAAVCAARRWTCWMLLGDFARAWRESILIENLAARDSTQLWDGSSLRGQRVLVRCLHGLGDAVQFVRYAGVLRPQATKVIVQVHPALVELFQMIDGVDEVITWPDLPGSEREWDRQVEVMELPRIFGSTIATIPRVVPYLSVAPSLVEAAQRALGSRRGFRLGIVWKTSSYDPNRDIDLDTLIPSIVSPNCELYSFQYGLTSSQLSEAQAKYQVYNIGPLLNRVETMAAAMCCMDLVISVDTFAAHLAGALAIPIWVLLPFAADWRWMIDRDDSPWYPSMRLWRQKVPGDWRSAVREIRPRLTALINQP